MWAIAIWTAIVMIVSIAARTIWELVRTRSFVAINQDEAKQRFKLRREWLEVEFLKAYTNHRVSRGLKWIECDFGDEVHFAFDQDHELLRAFVPLVIHFVPADQETFDETLQLEKLREATSVFEYNGKAWTAVAKPIYNLSPIQAIMHFRHKPVSID